MLLPRYRKTTEFRNAFVAALVKSRDEGTIMDQEVTLSLSTVTAIINAPIE
jgi:hypothetical protein